MASIFHKFIQVSANKPSQANIFVEFGFMEHDIRKSYKQLKDNKGVPKPSEEFVDYWKEIGKEGRQEQVAVYFRWIQLLQRAINKMPFRQLPDREAKLYIKKSMISKWDPKQVKLNRLTLIVFSKSLREYPLKCFGIRKSKNKQHFSWVMEVLMQVDQSKFKSFHIGTNNIIEYQEWYRDLENRIDHARIQYFKELIGANSNEKINYLPIRQDLPQKKLIQKSILPQNKPSPQIQNKSRMKTITQLVIDKELNQIEDFQGLQVIEESQLHDVREEQVHPNIFNKLFPQRSLDNFSDDPKNGSLLKCEAQHRLYQVEGKVKIFITIPHCLSLVFKVISESHRNWNPQIDIFTVKNKISSQNSILIYQKDKSKGFLYRQRDYFYLRHCFSIEQIGNRHRIFMVQKSIDSIHTPPFMSVARGEKDLIWELIGDPEQKQCLLIVQGLIKGGGYMNASEDIQTTIKHFKKLLQLQVYLKQTSYSSVLQQNLLFRQKWFVNLKQEEEEEFFSPRLDSDEIDITLSPKMNSNKVNIKEEEIATNKVKEEQYKQFMKHTSEEDISNLLRKRTEEVKCNFSSEDFNHEYTPPHFAEDRTIIIPNEYLKINHKIQPRPKGKEILGEKIKGHHLWKGQWAVSEAGGLNYVDEDKMRQQKKVLTFIIKRIGKNILTGKGILNISLPVDIFCRQSNIQRIAMSFGYMPRFLEKVVNAQDPLDQLKAILSASFGSSLIYLTMEKPFNPILGQTYQSWIDGCPVYFEQISHHPPIAAYFMKGRGYQLSGSVQAKMDISINSGTGNNQGIFTIKFDNGRTFHFTTPPGELSGLTYGQRKLSFVDKTYFWCIEEGLFLEMTYNPLSKQRGFFWNGGKNLVGQERLGDYFEGILRKYKTEDLRQFFTPKKNDSRKLMLIPKACPNSEIVAQLGKVSGRWTKYVTFRGQKIFEADVDNFYASYDEKNPLPSHSNFREDVVYRRLNNFVLSQQFKEVLEVKQRKDRKLREDYRKKNR